MARARDHPIRQPVACERAADGAGPGPRGRRAACWCSPSCWRSAVMRTPAILRLLVALAATALGAACAQGTPYGRIVRWIDGDTVRVAQ